MSMTREHFLQERALEIEKIAYEYYPMHDKEMEQKHRTLKAAAANIRSIIAITQAWPTMVAQRPQVEIQNDDLGQLSMVMTQNVEFLAVKAYTERFGEEPPTRPIIVEMVRFYKFHPDYNPEWD